MATRAQWNKCKQDTCPMDKYTTENCNMKRKPKYKKIKAWAIVRDSKIGEIDGCFESGNIPPKYFSSAYVPCTILIDPKYLKGEK